MGISGAHPPPPINNFLYKKAGYFLGVPVALGFLWAPRIPMNISFYSWTLLVLGFFPREDKQNGSADLKSSKQFSYLKGAIGYLYTRGVIQCHIADWRDLKWFHSLNGKDLLVIIIGFVYGWFFSDCTMVNHHQTSIWKNSFCYLFQAY